MRVSNRKILQKITWRTLKAGRFRNIIAIFAIALTATLFTSIFAIGGNTIYTFQDATMRMVGTSAHGGLKHLTQEQYDNFSKSPLIKDISYSIIVAGAENEALQDKQTEIRYSEDDSARWGFSYPTTGGMPKERNELACSTITLDELGLPHELGQTVTLEFSVHGKSYHEEFVLCGFWPGDDVMMATQIFLSREYVDSILSVPKAVDFESNDYYVGTISADVWFGNSINIESKLDKLVLECGYSSEEISTGINWAYLGGGEIDVITVLMVILLVLLVLVSGYLIIYSIFAISISGDIQFYGLLKTIGITGKQIKSIVRRQALLLSAAGIPLGLILGFLLGIVLTPVVMGLTTMNGDTLVSLHPLIFVFSALFSLITVNISCRRPAKIAARTSPVEAIRYTEANTRKKPRAQKKTHRVNLFTMAWSNVRRSPKKLAVVVGSLSLSLVLLGSVITIVDGFDMEEYLKDQMRTDFAIAHQSLYNAMTLTLDSEGVTQDTLAVIDSMPGLEASGNIYFSAINHTLTSKASGRAEEALNALRPRIAEGWKSALPVLDKALETGEVPMHVYAMNEFALELAGEEKVDAHRLNMGDYVYISHLDIDYDGEYPTLYDIGDKIPLINDAGETREFEVIGILRVPYIFTCQYSQLIESEIIMSEDAYLDFYGERNPMMTVFNVSDAHLDEAEKWLEEYCETTSPELTYRSREFYKGEFEEMKNTYLICGGVLSFILALIGILNFVNTMVTSIMTRKRELAMLQSIGMTGRQLKQMLFAEGLWYAVLTIGLTLTAGTGISTLIIQGFAGSLWFFSYNFSLLPMLSCSPVLILLCVIIPLLCARVLQKESVVERLREV